MENKIVKLIERVKKQSPLVHNIMNYVAINDCANVLLGIGASPIMADAPEEVEEITAMANALVLNTGTLKKWSKDSMIRAGRVANQRGIPVILDPVGVRASYLRKQTVWDILNQVQVAVIRGNRSEIAWVAEEEMPSTGVDCREETSLQTDIEIAKKAANKWNTTIAVTGKVDIITDGNQLIKVYSGTSTLSKVTGTGCMTTALIGAFLTEEDSVVAATAGISIMGIAGEIAQEQAGALGVGSFKVELMNALSRMDEEKIKEKLKIEKE
ncbi:Hydroxyethylthiazole kinase [Clostridiales bacterium CHKCI001]|nr:Hydroxyethylthiazole kinase [Clostridiales bacterium CHKCI001]